MSILRSKLDDQPTQAAKGKTTRRRLTSASKYSTVRAMTIDVNMKLTEGDDMEMIVDDVTHGVPTDVLTDEMVKYE